MFRQLLKLLYIFDIPYGVQNTIDNFHSNIGILLLTYFSEVFNVIQLLLCIAGQVTLFSSV